MKINSQALLKRGKYLKFKLKKQEINNKIKTMKTDISIILDRSGSMSSVREDTIGGYNTFLKDQQDVDGEAVWSLYQFDDRFETVVKAKNIKDVEQLTSKTFVPRGNTALLDAIGRVVNETGVRLDQMTDKPDKVVVVILTDGEENTSREYTRDKVFEMITHQKEKYQWEFVFLAANQDAIAAGRSFGINAGNAMTYAANQVGTQSAFLSTSRNLTSLRKGVTTNMCYTSVDREAQYAAGANS